MFYRRGEGRKKTEDLIISGTERVFLFFFFVLAADFYNLRRWSSSVQPTGISKTSHCLAKCASEGRPDKTSADGLAAASNANFMFRVHFADFARQNNITAERGSHVHSDQKWGLVRWSGKILWQPCTGIELCKRGFVMCDFQVAFAENVKRQCSSCMMTVGLSVEASSGHRGRIEEGRPNEMSKWPPRDLLLNI